MTDTPIDPVPGAPVPPLDAPPESTTPAAADPTRAPADVPAADPTAPAAAVPAASGFKAGDRVAFEWEDPYDPLAGTQTQVGVVWDVLPDEGAGERARVAWVDVSGPIDVSQLRPEAEAGTGGT